VHSIRGAAAAALAVLCAPTRATRTTDQRHTIAPALPGLKGRVLNYDDAIELVYDSERPLVVEGYQIPTRGRARRSWRSRLRQSC
jgi:hypothetical protein